MSKSYITAAMTMAMVIMAATAMAGSVDVGLGRMDRAEFEILRQMVSGEYQPSVSVSIEKPSQKRVAEFYQTDVDAIRQAMVNETAWQPATALAADSQLVDVGTGSMAIGEFCDLNKLVASNTATRESGFTFICP